MQADSPDNTIPPGEAEPIDAEFEPAKPEKRSGGGKAAARLAGFVLALILAAAAGGVAGWYAAGLNRPDGDTQPADAIARLESQMAGLEARLNAAEDRPLTEMVPTEALRTFDSTIRALEQRVEAVEARPAGEGAGLDDSGIDALLDGRDAALRTELEEIRALAANAATSGDGAPVFDPTPLQDALSTLEGRISAQESRLDTDLSALEERQSDAMDARDDALLDRIAALESRTEQMAANTNGEAVALERAAARILAFTALRESAMTGESFEAERAALARLWPNAPGLAALQPHARRGVPSAGELAESFPAASIRSASGETRRFLGLFEIRPADSAPDSALALVRQAEARLASDDLAGAVEAAARLDGAPAEAVSPWLAQARARLDIDSALTTLRNGLSNETTTPGRSTP